MSLFSKVQYSLLYCVSNKSWLSFTLCLCRNCSTRIFSVSCHVHTKKKKYSPVALLLSSISLGLLTYVCVVITLASTVLHCTTELNYPGVLKPLWSMLTVTDQLWVLYGSPLCLAAFISNGGYISFLCI